MEGELSEGDDPPYVSDCHSGLLVSISGMHRDARSNSARYEKSVQSAGTQRALQGAVAK